jgi:hypothetical protein
MTKFVQVQLVPSTIRLMIIPAELANEISLQFPTASHLLVLFKNTYIYIYIYNNGNVIRAADRCRAVYHTINISLMPMH